MLDLEPLYRLVSLLPFECLQAGFMQQALVALILLAPMAATMGVQVVSFRMAFFSDAISHSAFAGVALGLIFSINPHVAMPVFGILVGLGIMAVQRNSALSSDTIIGVFFSAVMAFGLAVVSRDNAVARDLQQFLYGDILTITETDIRWLIGLFFALAAFQIWGYNRLLYIGLNSVVAKAHRINVFFWQYLFAGLLALVVMFSVWAVGVLLVTALLIVPAATPQPRPHGRGHVLVVDPRQRHFRRGRAGALRTGMGRDSHRSDRCPRFLRLVPAERRSRRHTGRGTAPVTLS